MGDVNSYALNLAFQIQTSAASKALKGISDSITDIQDAIKETSKLFATQFANSATKLSDTFDKMAKSVSDVYSTTGDIIKSIIKLNKLNKLGCIEQEDNTKDYESRIDTLSTILDHTKDVNKSIGDGVRQQDKLLARGAMSKKAPATLSQTSSIW